MIAHLDRESEELTEAAKESRADHPRRRLRRRWHGGENGRRMQAKKRGEGARGEVPRSGSFSTASLPGILEGIRIAAYREIT